ncbi:MAG: hypothetical protein ACM3XN_07635, partial [Chloroflexota bacterium]
VSANDAALACAGDGACRMWDISNNKWAGFARGHVGNVVAVSACTAGESVPTKHVVTACDDGYAYLWNLEAGRCEWRIRNRGRSARTVAYSPRLRCVVVAGPAGELELWSVEVPKGVDWDDGAAAVIAGAAEGQRATPHDIDRLMLELSIAGFGWIRRETVVRRLQDSTH